MSSETARGSNESAKDPSASGRRNAPLALPGPMGVGLVLIAAAPPIGSGAGMSLLLGLDAALALVAPVRCVPRAAAHYGRLKPWPSPHSARAARSSRGNAPCRLTPFWLVRGPIAMRTVHALHAAAGWSLRCELCSQHERKLVPVKPSPQPKYAEAGDALLRRRTHVKPQFAANRRRLM
jgi:hypothetical protein